MGTKETRKQRVHVAVPVFVHVRGVGLSAAGVSPSSS